MKFSSPSRRRIVMAAIGVALMVALVFVGGEAAFRAVAEANLAYIAAALLLSALFYPLASWRWGLLTNAVVGRTVASQWDYLRIRVLSGASGFFMPREAAEIGGRTIWLNKARQVPLTQAAQAVLLDRLCDLFVTVVSLFGAALYLLGVTSTTIAFAVIVVSVFAAAVLFPPGLRLVAAAGRRPLAFVQRMLERLPRLGRQIAELPPLGAVPDSTWRTAMLLSAVKFLLVMARVVLLGMAVGVTLSAIDMMILVPLGQLAYLIAVTPAGLGIYEAGWFGILNAFGVSTAVASAFVLVLRACLILSVGMMVPLVLLRRQTVSSAVAVTDMPLQKATESNV